ncbi:MAG: SGNH/GDSL hydrolase family protein [Armatimonadetes bacterium]|nr:SGNH/GDSL hydrolase family protein [Armatimonadota bacterium]
MRARFHYRRIWFLGDSLTAGYDASAESACFRTVATASLQAAALLQDAGALVIHSANQYGGKVKDGVRQAIAEASFAADIAVLQFGENDRPYAVAFPEQYARLIAQFQREGRRPLIVAFSIWAPTPDAYSAAVNADIRALVETSGGAFVDIQAAASDPLNREEGRDVTWLGDEQHTLSDSFHPNDRGHAKMATALIDALSPWTAAGPRRLAASGRQSSQTRGAAAERVSA